MNQPPQDQHSPYQPNTLVDFNLIDYVKQIKLSSDGQLVWDPVRKKWLARLPEELVRLSLILYLNDAFGISFKRMVVERQTSNQHLRLDLAVYDSNGQVHLLVECKAPEVRLNNDHIIQIGRYNQDVLAQYVMITNGIHGIAMDLRNGEILEKLSTCFACYS